jgi:hypothetical protein
MVSGFTIGMRLPALNDGIEVATDCWPTMLTIPAGGNDS